MFSESIDRSVGWKVSRWGCWGWVVLVGGGGRLVGCGVDAMFGRGEVVRAMMPWVGLWRGVSYLIVVDSLPVSVMGAGSWVG
jgi:hypothetical protein